MADATERPVSLVEIRLLQVCVALGGLVPVGAGLIGVLFGLAMVPDGAIGVSSDSHFRYLSGLLFAIGLGFWSTVSDIENKGPRFRLLTLIVVAGGLGRLYGLLVTGIPANPMLFGLVMELAVTPAVCLWRERVARNCCLRA
jgi:hypothetical protein